MGKPQEENANLDILFFTLLIYCDLRKLAVRKPSGIQ